MEVIIVDSSEKDSPIPVTTLYYSDKKEEIINKSGKENNTDFRFINIANNHMEETAIDVLSKNFLGV